MWLSFKSLKPGRSPECCGNAKLPLFAISMRDPLLRIIFYRNLFIFHELSSTFIFREPLSSSLEPALPPVLG